MTLYAAERRVADAESALNRAKVALRDLSETLIPAIMREAGETEWDTPLRVMKLAFTVYADIPTRFHDEAMIWLANNGAQPSLRATVTVDFPKGDIVAARSCHQGLIDDGLVPDLETTIHNSTLRAFARKRLAEGKSLNMDLLGIHAIWRTTTHPKESASETTT